MKKLLILMAVALLVLALVACGDEPAATTDGATVATTAPTVITTVPTVDTTVPTVITTVPTANTTVPTANTTAPVTTTPVVTTKIPGEITTAPVTTTPAVITTAPATTTKNETPVAPELDYTNAINLNEIGLSNVGIEDHHADHDRNLVLAFYLGNNDAWAALYGAGTPATENGLWTVNEGYTAIVTVNGVARETNRFTYYGFKDDAGVTNRGFFRFELAPFEDVTTNGITCTLSTTFTLVGADNKVVCYASFEDMKYSTLEYTVDEKNPGKDALVVTPISGPDFDGGEGTKKLFDNKTTTKLCKSDRTPVVFSLAEAKTLGGLSLVTANDNSSYKGRTVTGFTLYGGNSEDAIDNVVLTVTEAGMADVDFTEYYYAIEGAAAYQYYKIVFDGTNTFQFSEMWVYEAGEVVISDGKLPGTGIAAVTVDVNTVKLSVETWAANPAKDAFDGNIATSKLGTNKTASQPVTLEFSLTEAATVTWYTFFTGNDTLPQYTGRNPQSWVMYGKVNGEWVVLSEVTEPGMIEQWARPYSFAIENPVECKDFKIVFEPSSDIFQLNEIVLYKNDATAKAPTAAYLMDGAEVAMIHATGYNADAYRIRTTNKADLQQFGNEAMAEITKEGAYVWVKDLTNGGDFVKYEIKEWETSRHCDINFVLEGFVPVEGNQYEFLVFFMTGASSKVPNTLHVLPFIYTIPLAQ